MTVSEVPRLRFCRDRSTPPVSPGGKRRVDYVRVGVVLKNVLPMQLLEGADRGIIGFSSQEGRVSSRIPVDPLAHDQAEGDEAALEVWDKCNVSKGKKPRWRRP